MAAYTRICCVLVACCLGLPAGAVAAGKRTTVLVMDFHTEGVGGKVALQITGAVVDHRFQHLRQFHDERFTLQVITYQVPMVEPRWIHVLNISPSCHRLTSLR